MKRFRPYCTGYIVLYVLTLLCLGDSVYTVISQLRGSNNPMISSFSMFSYIILALALGYTYMYIRAQVAIDDRSLRVAWPAYIQPREGEKRALFLYRQGNLDIKFIDKTIPLRRIVRYGFVEDLGYQPVDRTDPQGKVKFFPVHEVAIITDDNKRYHMNAGIYSEKQQREIFRLIAEKTGVEPEGKLKALTKGAAA